LYRESNHILEGPLHPRVLGTDSHALPADALDDQVRDRLIEAFFERVGNLEKLPLASLVPLRGRGRAWYSAGVALLTKPLKRPPIRIVEKSPRNTLRIPLVQRLFPDARFLHLTRDAPANIASLYGGWLDPDRYNVHPLPPGFRLRGYDGSHWCFVKQPGWRTFDGASLADVCAEQWRACNEHCVRDLRDLPPDRVLRIKFEDLIRSPADRFAEIAAWAALDPKPLARFSTGLPVIQRSTKWRASPDEMASAIDAALPRLASLRAELGYV
jgi:hypothetical protein